jgi:hypothetical protein
LNVNQLTFALGAMAGLIIAAIAFGVFLRLWPAIRALRGSAGLVQLTAFEQWPTTAVVVNPETLQIIAAGCASTTCSGSRVWTRSGW